MIGYINDYCVCDECQNEAPVGYRVLHSIVCGECLEDLYVELEDKYA
jgi:hypothetical protein